MIRYQLRCSEGHEVDAWFRNSSAFDEQARKGLIVCPHCGDTKLSKSPMAPAVAKSASSGTSETQARKVAEQILQAVATLRDKVEAECDYVGDRFAEEARRIHYGEADHRGIYGEATIEEAIDLGEEGIDIAPLPASPKPNGKN